MPFLVKLYNYIARSFGGDLEKMLSVNPDASDLNVLSNFCALLSRKKGSCIPHPTFRILIAHLNIRRLYHGYI